MGLFFSFVVLLGILSHTQGALEFEGLRDVCCGVVLQSSWPGPSWRKVAGQEAYSAWRIFYGMT